MRAGPEGKKCDNRFLTIFLIIFSASDFNQIRAFVLTVVMWSKGNQFCLNLSHEQNSLSFQNFVDIEQY